MFRFNQQRFCQELEETTQSLAALETLVKHLSSASTSNDTVAENDEDYDEYSVENLSCFGGQAEETTFSLRGADGDTLDFDESSCSMILSSPPDNNNESISSSIYSQQQQPKALNEYEDDRMGGGGGNNFSSEPIGEKDYASILTEIQCKLLFYIQSLDDYILSHQHSYSVVVCKVARSVFLVAFNTSAEDDIDPASCSSQLGVAGDIVWEIINTNYTYNKAEVLSRTLPFSLSRLEYKLTFTVIMNHIQSVLPKALVFPAGVFSRGAIFANTVEVIVFCNEHITETKSILAVLRQNSVITADSGTVSTTVGANQNEQFSRINSRLTFKDKTNLTLDIKVFENNNWIGLTRYTGPHSFVSKIFRAPSSCNNQTTEIESEEDVFTSVAKLPYYLNPCHRM